MSPQPRWLCPSTGCGIRASREISGSNLWRNPKFQKTSSPCAKSRLGLGENVKVTQALDNHEIRMTKLEGMTNDQMTNNRDAASSSLGLAASFVIRHSCFVIFCGLILILALQMCASLAQAESPNLTGRWDVEITFANGDHRSLRFDAQAAGKGSFLVLDPRLKVWGPARPSEAKWTQGDGNTVTFSGPVEFLIGNVGRDAGTLMFKGKFETDSLITGEVEFSPLVGDRPSKNGTFKAVRAAGG